MCEKTQGYYAKLHEQQRIEESRQEMNRRILAQKYEGQSTWPEEAVIAKLKKEARKWRSSY